MLKARSELEQTTASALMKIRARDGIHVLTASTKTSGNPEMLFC